MLVPAHTTAVPLMIGVNAGLTVTVSVTAFVQPFELVYVYVIVAEPDATPVTSPVIEFTVATVASLLVQAPPAVVFVKIVVEPTHALFVPEIAARVGNAFTLTVVCALDSHPFVVTV